MFMFSLILFSLYSFRSTFRQILFRSTAFDLSSYNC